MAVCPLCNGFQQLDNECPSCHAHMNDAGKVSDYLDPYGHYNDDETVKMGDGYPDTAKGLVCPHLFVCASCGKDEVVFVAYQD